MKPSRRIWRIAGGAGAAATTAVAAVGAMVSRQRKHGVDVFEGESVGEFEPDRVSTVAADDGTPLAVAEIDPLEGGEPELTVVGVHGFALSARSWYFQQRALSGLRIPALRQVYYDHRGHGQSGSATADGSTIEQLAVDMHAVLRAVVPEGPIVLVGHSMGGMVIMELAQRYPELFTGGRVRGVALIATAAGELASRGVSRGLLSKYNPLTRGVGGLASAQPGLVELIRAASGQLTRQAVRSLAFGSRDVSPRLVDFMLEMLAVTSVRDLANFVQTLGTHHRYAALAELARARVLVVGADTDRLTPFAHAEAIAAEVAGADLVRVRGAGHMVQLEQAELVNSHLIDLVQRCGDADGSDSARRGRWWRR